MASVLHLAQRTVWLTTGPCGLFIAVDFYGHELASNKYKSTLEMIVRKKISEEKLDIVAIAPVVLPDNRIPHRRVTKTKAMRRY